MMGIEESNRFSAYHTRLDGGRDDRSTMAARHFTYTIIRALPSPQSLSRTTTTRFEHFNYSIPRRALKPPPTIGFRPDQTYSHHDERSGRRCALASVTD